MRKCTRAVRTMVPVRHARGPGLAARLCIAVTALVLLGSSSAAQAVEVPPLPKSPAPVALPPLPSAAGLLAGFQLLALPPVPATPSLPGPEDVLKLLKGPTGPIGPAGPTGPAGVGGGGGNGEASSFGKYTGVGSTGGLASGKQESGLWSATIHAPAGSFQQQAQGVASFPIPLKFHEKVALNYRPEGAPSSAPCLGSVEEPVVLPAGNFCAYRGGKSAGAKETGANGSVDKEAKFIGFEGSGGEATTETGLAGEGDDGVLIVFRTNTFGGGGEPARELLAEADLNAIGSWAVAAK